MEKPSWFSLFVFPSSNSHNGAKYLFSQFGWEFLKCWDSTKHHYWFPLDYHLDRISWKGVRDYKWELQYWLRGKSLEFGLFQRDITLRNVIEWVWRHYVRQQPRLSYQSKQRQISHERKYKKLNATSKRLWPNCDFAMMTDNLSTHNLHTTIQHVEILYDIFLRLECKSGWFIWIFPIEYTIALRIIKFMINDIPLNCWLVFSYFVAIVV